MLDVDGSGDLSEQEISLLLRELGVKVIFISDLVNSEGYWGLIIHFAVPRSTKACSRR